MRARLGILAVFAGIYVALCTTAYLKTSATWDEPQNLTSGYLALAAGDYRVDPEHPPLLRTWAALPLLALDGIAVDREGVGADDGGPWLRVGQLAYCHRFCYTKNDADRMLYRARFQIVLIGVLLGVLLFSWAQELFGLGVAAGVLGLYLLEPNEMAHAQLVTTDLGLTCFVFGAVYFAWRTSRRLTVWNLIGLGAFSSLALLSKFSGILLSPILAVLLFRRPMRPRAALLIFLGIGVAAYATAWAAYGFRYAPAPGGAAPFQVEEAERAALPALAQLVSWSNDHRLLPNALTKGLLVGQMKARARAGYFAGQYRQTGWWYYFPVAFLIKTPLAVILLAFLGAIVGSRNRLFVLFPIAVFMGVAMFARLNIGLRHVLPIYPFVLLAAGWGIQGLRGWRGRGRLALVAAGLLLVAEFARAAPHHLAFFNLAAGGPAGGSRWLVDSNLDWGQDLKGLKRWMDAHGVTHVNLSYFGTANPAYYGIDCTYLPGSFFYAKDRMGEPEAPGYFAVSATNLRMPQGSDRQRAMSRYLLTQKPVAVIGHTIYVYRLEAVAW